MNLLKHLRPGLPVGLPVSLLVGLLARSLAADPADAWQLLPFSKVDAVNPCLSPTSVSEFESPWGGRVKWEEAHVFNPAAVVRDGQVWILYRAQDRAGTSRLGLASSRDGLHFQRRPTPVLYPAKDAMEKFESVGGCEDPRVVEDEKGRYLLTYTGYDGKTARLMTATSKDLIHWTKHGPAFDGEMREEWTKSGAIVCRPVGDRFVATKVQGKYWMYFRDSKFLLAHSTDLVHWQTVLDAAGKPRSIVEGRPGKFDSDLVEPGPQALLRDDGILLLYNGVNAKTGGDPRLPAGNFAAGQLLFDKSDPARVLKRSDDFFLTPDRPYEITGQVGNVCFIEGLVRFKGDWFLYYGTADSKVAVAVRRGRP